MLQTDFVGLGFNLRSVAVNDSLDKSDSSTASDNGFLKCLQHNPCRIVVGIGALR